jgi:hypothetical protein
MSSSKAIELIVSITVVVLKFSEKPLTPSSEQEVIKPKLNAIRVNLFIFIAIYFF